MVVLVGCKGNNMTTLQNMICRVERGRFLSQQNRLKIKFIMYLYNEEREEREKQYLLES